MVEHAEIRVGLWHMILDMMKEGHRFRFPGRAFGPDLELYFLFCTAVMMDVEKKPVRASALARYLEMPNETVRRRMDKLVELGLLERDGKLFKPTPQGKRFRRDGVWRIFNKAAARLL
jgi:IclR helix-turn-helix domain